MCPSFGTRCATRIAVLVSLIGLTTFAGCSEEPPVSNQDIYNQGISRQDLSGQDLSCPGCNVILLNIELLRADFVGLLKGNLNSSPNIDNFFKNGILFEQAHSPAGETYRANLAIQTVREVHRYNIDSGLIDDLMYPDRLTQPRRAAIRKNLTRFSAVAEMFLNAGYNTIGLNHGYRAGRQTFLDRGFSQFTDWPRKYVLMGQTAYELREQLLDLEYPSYILYRTVGLHAKPVLYPVGRPRVDSEKIRYEHDVRHNLIVVDSTQEWEEDPENAAFMLIYVQQLRYVDDELALVFLVLERAGLVDNSIIVLYSNHGDSLGENGIPYGKHGVSYQSNTHVPLLIRHPKIDSQIRIDTPISIIDLFPTIFEFTGIKSVSDFDGMSLVPLITIGKSQREYIFGRNDEDEYVRWGNWKLIVKHGREDKLFDLQHDPGEKEDLILTNKGIAQQLRAKLLQHKTRLLQEGATSQKNKLS